MQLDLKTHVLRQHYAAQLVSILAYLRTQQVVHRDIKPANLLLNEKWQLVLADFGTAKVEAKNSITDHCALRKSKSTKDVLSQGLVPLSNSKIQEEPDLVGSQEYISPEGVAGIQSRVGHASDLWSLGVILWQMHSRQNETPFMAETQESTF